MGRRPYGPVKLDSVASSNGDIGATRCCCDMAGDVQRSEAADEAEAAILGNRTPSNDWNWVCVLEVRVLTRRVDTVDNNARDIAVC